MIRWKSSLAWLASIDISSVIPCRAAALNSAASCRLCTVVGAATPCNRSRRRKRRRARRRRQRLLFSALGVGATPAAPDAAATVVVPGSTLRGAARHLGKRRRRPASPVSAASRSLERRARAASARASALATSSSASASETGATAPESTPERGGGSSELVTSAGSSEWSASGPSGSCTEKQPITSAWAQRCHRAAAFVALHAEMLARQADGAGAVRSNPAWSAIGSGYLLQLGEFSFQFLFGCGKVMGCDSSWQWLPRCSAPVCWRRRHPGRADRLRLPRLHPRHHGASGSRRAV